MALHIGQSKRNYDTKELEKLQKSQNVGSTKHNKAKRNVAKVPKGPIYHTRIAIRDRRGNIIAESMRPPKDSSDPSREIRVRDQDSPELDPDYWDHRIWKRTGQVPGQSWNTRVQAQKPGAMPRTRPRLTENRNQML